MVKKGKLLGFATSREKQVFEKLITISGIGPKLAQSILSGIDVNELRFQLQLVF